MDRYLNDCFTIYLDETYPEVIIEGYTFRASEIFSACAPGEYKKAEELFKEYQELELLIIKKEEKTNE